MEVRLIGCFWSFVGCNDAFVEVGMPRSPSHSANANDLKQMMSTAKQSCTKRQTVELLQGTKNTRLQYVPFIKMRLCKARRGLACFLWGCCVNKNIICNTATEGPSCTTRTVQEPGSFTISWMVFIWLMCFSPQTCATCAVLILYNITPSPVLTFLTL